MKKLLFITFTFVALNLTAQDQNFEGEIKWSELFEITSKTLSPDIIGQDGESIYITRIIKGKRYMEKYSVTNLTLQASVLIELVYNKNKLYLMDHFMFKGTPVFMTGYFDKKMRTSYTFIQTVDPGSLALSEPKKISEIYMMNAGKSSFMLTQSQSLDLLSYKLNSGMEISENGEFAFYMTPEINSTTTEEDIAAGNISIKGLLFGEDGEIIEESQFKIPVNNFYTIRTKVSNEGEVYLLGYEMIIEENNDKGVFQRDKIVLGDLHLLLIDFSTDEVLSTIIDTEEKTIESITMDFNQAGGLSIGGLYSSDGKGVAGSFIIGIDQAFDITTSTFTDFEDDFITSTWSEKKKENYDEKQDKGKNVDEPVFYNYDVNHLISKPDGSSLMLAEQYYVRVVTHTHRGANGSTYTTTTYYYYYNNIIAVNYDADGNLAWKTIIEKYQVSANDGGYYSSYFTLQNENDVRIIYNDRKLNNMDTEGMSNAEKKELKSSTIGVSVNLDSEGEQSKEILFEFEEGGLRLVPKACEKISGQLVFLYARSSKGDKIGTIAF